VTASPGIPEVSPSATPVLSGSSQALTVTCGPPSDKLSNPTPEYLNAQQVKKYIASYDSMPLRGLRTAFDAYVAGRADSDTTTNLRPYGATLVSDGFRLFAISRGLGGGEFIFVQFSHHPDAMYEVWLYTLADGKPTIRAFRGAQCTSAQQRWLAVTFASTIALGDDRTLMSVAAPSPTIIAPVVNAQAAPRPSQAEPTLGPVPEARGNTSHVGDESGCEDVSVQAIYADGEIIELDDGRRLHVAAGDDVTASVWVPPFDGLLCPDKLVNTDDNESVELGP
jgi:hypothetical protein